MTTPDSSPAPKDDPGLPAPLGSIGKYVLIKKIAEGGMGSIFLGKNKEDDSYAAIKVMASQYIQNPILVKRFEQEFRIANKLNHPNLVRALEFGATEGKPYLVLEYVHGESLGKILERQGWFEEMEGIRIIAQVANGLNRAHRENLIHRDVKPDNILLTKNGLAKLADMGLVKEKMSGDLNLTRSGRGLGTPNFMAPEQFRNAKNADERCDIYSLGATLYTLLTGELPYKSINALEAWMKKVNNELTPPRELNPKISSRTDWAIRRAMDCDPDVRPSTCREFVEDLTGKSTRNPVTASSGPVPAEAAQQDVWYLAYVDDQGKQHVVRGSARAIRRSFKEEILEDPLRYKVSQSRNGPFLEMKDMAEFRDLGIQLTKVKDTKIPIESQSSTPDADAKTEPILEKKQLFSSWYFYLLLGGLILTAGLLALWAFK